MGPAEVRWLLLPFSLRAEKRNLGDPARLMVSPRERASPSLPLVLALRWPGGPGAELSCFNPTFPRRQIHLLLHRVNELQLIIICSGHHL